MKRIYKVIFDEKWIGSSQWTRSELNILANGNAQDAIDKAKHTVLAQTYEGENGKMQKCNAFRLTEVRVLAETS